MSLSSNQQLTPSEEKVHNSFIKALQPGGILERAVLFRRPFDAVFVPRQKRLEELQLVSLLEAKPNPNYSLSVYDEETGGVPASARAQLIQDGDGRLDPAVVLRIPHSDPKCRELLALFLEHHIGSFDSFGLAPTFSLMCGLRGSISEFLDTIGVAGRLAKVPIAAHMSPTTALVSTDPKMSPPTTDPETLNIFLLEDTILEAYDLRKYLAKIKGAQLEMIESVGKKDVPPPGKFSRFITDLFGSDSQTAIISTTTETPEAQFVQSNFQKFQEKMQKPESKFLARSVTAFIDYCNGTSSISSAANAAAIPNGGAAMGVANRNKPISPREVQSVVDQLMAQVSSLKEWKGMEEMALEGFEKYIMTKIYKRTFCFTEDEKGEAKRFSNRLMAFNEHVSEQSFELLPMVSECPQWRQAVVELGAMGDYKCPRDKLVCGTNACRLIIRALEVAAEQKKRGEGASPLVTPEDPTTPIPSSVGTADVFLPALFLCVVRSNPSSYLANVRFIDRYRHRSLLDNEAGYLLTCLLSVVEFWQTATQGQLGISEGSYQAAMASERAMNNTTESKPTQVDAISPPPPAKIEPKPADVPHTQPTSHSDPLDSFFGLKASNAVTPVASISEAPARPPQKQIKRDEQVDAVFAKLEACEGNIASLTISELQMVATEALRLRKSAE